ncbi:MAG: D-alanyl-D-alanine carboxypeptidase, partial [Betaproteobacteria bacterium]|nr:D-alanyl-D-alanine carboxypeptidase [Betaproteobacteria bacterium]
LRNKKISLQQTLAVSTKAWKMQGSRMFIDPNMQVPVEDLIKGMIVQSGNDATIALAEGVGGTSEHFVNMMNAQAKALGMLNTVYKNPEGLSEPGHTTTARDLSKLATRLIQDFPDFVGYYAIKKYRYPGTPAANDANRNLLLFRDPSVDGLKTGHTDAAGYCLVATAKRDFPNLQGRRMLAIVLGASSENARAEEAQKLLNWGYTAYDGIKLFEANQAVVSPVVYKGKESQVNLGRPTSIVVAVPQGQTARLKTLVTRPDPLLAPLQKNQQIATLKVMLDQQPLTEIPLLALTSVEEAGFVGRTWDALTLWLK